MIVPLYCYVCGLLVGIGIGGIVAVITRRRCDSRGAIEWNDGYGVGYLQGLRDSSRTSR